MKVLSAAFDPSGFRDGMGPKEASLQETGL